MTAKGKIITAVVVLAALALGWYGTVRYLDYRRDRADRRASECVNIYMKIVGEGTNSVPAEQLGPVLAEMAELSRTCSPSMAELLFARRLDGTFLTGDYAGAERMMDDIPGKSDNWKFGAKAKIRAHAALARGDKAAAIPEFETFCQALLKEPDIAECDPYTGIEWPCEALLARNYNRLSGLAKDTGDAARAKKFLDEARKYAKLAMKKAEEDADLKEVLVPEFAELLK